MYIYTDTLCAHTHTLIATQIQCQQQQQQPQQVATKSCTKFKAIKKTICALIKGAIYAADSAVFYVFL